MTSVWISSQSRQRTPAAVKATEAALGGGLAGANDALGVLVSFDVIFVTAGALLFPAIVSD